MTARIRIKVRRVSVIKTKINAPFPSRVEVENFLTITKANGIYTFGVDYTKLAEAGITDPGTAKIALLDESAQVYKLVSVADIIAGGLDGDLQAIGALTGTGILARTADDTWTLRAIAGTANEVTVTNGNGVSGNPTVSLPSALTFTGKTVTGGTFNGPVITSPTGIVKGDVGLGNVDNTSDLNKPISTATQTALNAKVTGPASVTDDLPAIFDGTTGKLLKSKTYAAFKTLLALVKGDVGLGNVDNTSDATKWAATATLTNKTYDTAGTGNSLSINGVAVTANTGTGAVVRAASPALTGSPTAPTASPLDSSTKVATTKYVDDAVTAGGGGGGGSAVLRGYISGLTLSNDAVTPNTILDIAAGVATSDDATTSMALASAITKTTGSWVVGSGNGGLDTGTVANSTWYHVFQIMRTDTSVVDVLFSTSPTAPTMPTNYTKKRRIGSFKTNASAQIIAFLQFGNEFVWSVPVNDVVNNDPGTAALLRTLSVPTGVSVRARFWFYLQSADVFRRVALITSPNQPDTTPSAGVMSSTACGVNSAAQGIVQSEFNVWTNTSGQIRYRMDSSAATVAVFINTAGWVDLL